MLIALEGTNGTGKSSLMHDIARKFRLPYQDELDCRTPHGRLFEYERNMVVDRWFFSVASYAKGLDAEYLNTGIDEVVHGLETEQLLLIHCHPPYDAILARRPARENYDTWASMMDDWNPVVYDFTDEQSIAQTMQAVCTFLGRGT